MFRWLAVEEHLRPVYIPMSRGLCITYAVAYLFAYALQTVRPFLPFLVCAIKELLPVVQSNQDLRDGSFGNSLEEVGGSAWGCSWGRVAEICFVGVSWLFR